MDYIVGFANHCWSGAPIKLLSLEFYAGCSLLVLFCGLPGSPLLSECGLLGDFLFCGLPGVPLLVKVTCLTAATQAGHAAM